MPRSLRPPPKLSPVLGLNFWRIQLLLLAIAAVISGLYWLLQGNSNPTPQILSTFIIGNCSWLASVLAAPVYIKKKSPWDLLAYLGVLLPVAVVASSLASLASRIVVGRVQHVLELDWADIRTGTFFSLAAGVALFIVGRERTRLQRRNLELERQITIGRFKLQVHEAELKAAHEIQARLLPRELPQVRPFQIACAWEPARSVGGDYFDVLELGLGRLGLCIADVSGKGITAALLMANLQAAVRAFAPGGSGPGALCSKLNQVLCASVGPGKFVTLFYGVIESETLTLRFENAGHCPPIVLRGEEAMTLCAGGTVLGLFLNAAYEERQFELRIGDCLLLMTDGVTEAADENDQEYGSERLIAAARAARSLGAQGIRTAILEDVTRFCKGNFQDDASLIVATVGEAGDGALM